MLSPVAAFGLEEQGDRPQRRRPSTTIGSITTELGAFRLPTRPLCRRSGREGRTASRAARLPRGRAIRRGRTPADATMPPPHGSLTSFWTSEPRGPEQEQRDGVAKRDRPDKGLPGTVRCPIPSSLLAGTSCLPLFFQAQIVPRPETIVCEKAIFQKLGRQHGCVFRRMRFFVSCAEAIVEAEVARSRRGRPPRGRPRAGSGSSLLGQSSPHSYCEREDASPRPPRGPSRSRRTGTRRRRSRSPCSSRSRSRRPGPRRRA